MRYGILSDIHGNLEALRVAVQTLERAQVDRYLVAGDLVGYGPEPNECVEVVAGLDAICIAGNHDLIAIERMSPDRCVPIARESLRWTRDTLSADAEAFLAALPLRAATSDGVVIAHGSLDDPQEYTTRPAQARAQLARMTRELPGSRVLVLGHTHWPWAFGRQSGARPIRGRLALPDEAVLLNPGAVGQSRELRCRARCLLVDLADGSATFWALRYDVAACLMALRREGLSPRSHHFRPSLSALTRRGIRRMMSR